MGLCHRRVLRLLPRVISGLTQRQDPAHRDAAGDACEYYGPAHSAVHAVHLHPVSARPASPSYASLRSTVERPSALSSTGPCSEHSASVGRAGFAGLPGPAPQTRFGISTAGGLPRLALSQPLGSVACMSMRRSNPRLQGLIGVGAAIDWFTRAGYVVSIPLNDNQPYDLVVDDSERLLRVQVKTTTARGRYGNFQLALQTAGGNQSFHTRKPFDNTASELLFALTDAGDVYVIPCHAIAARTMISLCGKYDAYRQPRWPDPAAVSSGCPNAAG